MMAISSISCDIITHKANKPVENIFTMPRLVLKLGTKIRVQFGMRYFTFLTEKEECNPGYLYKICLSRYILSPLKVCSSS